MGQGTRNESTENHPVISGAGCADREGISTMIATLQRPLFMVLVTIAFNNPSAYPALLEPSDDIKDKPGPSSLPTDPSFDAHLTDGTVASGPILAFGPGEQLTLGLEDEERVIAFDQLVKLIRPETSVPYPPSGTMLVLPDGDRLRALIHTAGEEGLQITSEIFGELKIPLEAVIGLILSPPAVSEERRNLLLRVQQESRDLDVFWLTNNDRRAGTFVELDSRRVSFQLGGRVVELSRSDIQAIGLDPALANYPKPKKNPLLELTLTDGSRLGVTEPSFQQGKLIATTRFGAELQIPIRDLARIHWLGGSVSYLSEREVAGDQYVSYIGPSRPYQRDASVLGLPMRISGEYFDRGIGTQSRSLLAYRLEPEDRRFQALVGLDDQASSLGNVIFKVLVDGEERFASPPLSIDDDPIAIDLDVSEAGLLILITEFGLRGGIRDYANWAEARIVR